MVTQLGAGGMSSDESDTDESGKEMYRIKRLPWRNPKIVEYMEAIDADYNDINAYGHRRAGNPRRTRIRDGTVESSRDAIKGYPVNFYDKRWYDDLSARQRIALEATPEVPLPEFSYEAP